MNLSYCSTRGWLWNVAIAFKLPDSRRIVVPLHLHNRALKFATKEIVKNEQHIKSMYQKRVIGIKFICNITTLKIISEYLMSYKLVSILFNESHIKRAIDEVSVYMILKCGQ